MKRRTYSTLIIMLLGYLSYSQADLGNGFKLMNHSNNMICYDGVSEQEIEILFDQSLLTSLQGEAFTPYWEFTGDFACTEENLEHCSRSFDNRLLITGDRNSTIIKVKLTGSGTSTVYFRATGVSTNHTVYSSTTFQVSSISANKSYISFEDNTQALYCESGNIKLSFTRMDPSDFLATWEVSDDGVTWPELESYEYNNDEELSYTLTQTQYYRVRYERCAMTQYTEPEKIEIVHNINTTVSKQIKQDLYEYDLSSFVSGSGTWIERKGTDAPITLTNSVINPIEKELNTPYHYVYTDIVSSCPRQKTFNVTYIPHSGLNSVIEHTILKSGTTTESQVDGLSDITGKTTTVHIINGLGDEIETKEIKAGGNREDIIQTVEVNEQRQIKKSYVSVPIANTGYGYTTITESLIKSMYDINNLATDEILTLDDLYTEYVYEESPRPRPLQQIGVGNEWKSGNRKLEYRYEISSYLNGFYLKSDETVGKTSYYDLFVTTTKDENNNEVKEYKNTEGQVIMQENADGKQTHYVYDVYGNVRYVLPPLAVENFTSGTYYSGSYNPDIIFVSNINEGLSYEYCINQEINLEPGFDFEAVNDEEFTIEVGTSLDCDSRTDVLDEYAYSYKYDGFNRVIEKKLPGIAPIYNVYDRAGNLIFTQDGNMRVDGNLTDNVSTWRYNVYDYQKRVVETGKVQLLYSDRALLQQWIENAPSLLYTKRGATAKGYLDEGITNYVILGIGSNREIDIINFYDNYINLSNEFSYHDMSYKINSISNYLRDNYDGTTTNTYFSRVNGLLTASMVRILDGEQGWQLSKMYYNDKYQVIQTVTTNQQNGVDYTYAGYNFVGKPITTKIEHFVEGTTVAEITQQQQIGYDHRMRLTIIKLSTNNDIPSDFHYIVQNSYDALGRLEKKELDDYTYPSAPPIDALQTINYKYNIRGWLTDINDANNLGNDLFAEHMNYATYMQELGQTKVDMQYNGNISSVTWATAEGLEAYAYTYDTQNRLVSTQYGYAAAGVFTSQNQYTEPNITYDLQGNITSLQRYGKTDVGGLMDDLQYSYQGNKLMSVEDIGDDIKGFADNADRYQEYDYDANGNMTRDDNSYITNIEYNFLNLPKKITKENFVQKQTVGPDKMVTSEETYFEYTAIGQKRKYKCKTTYSDGSIQKTYIEYDGIVVYKGSSNIATQDPQMGIDYILQPEGRIRVSTVNDVMQFTYEYHIKDHLGNTRVAFDAVQVGMWYQKQAVPFQSTDYYSFGMEHEQDNPYAPTQGQEENQNYKYNGKEFYSNLGWSDYGARFYNNSIGRWMSVDPMSEKYMSQSTYHFSGNNPVNLVDMNGMTYRDWMGGDLADWKEKIDKQDQIDAFWQQIEEAANKASENISVSSDIVSNDFSNNKASEDKNSNNKTFPAFEKLWTNYPHDINGKHQHPSADVYAKNQCAIRVGYCLQQSGVDMSNYNTGPITSEGYPRGSKSLADWIWREYGSPKVVSQLTFESDYWDKTGIIYIAPPEGGIGHIDLFNKGNTGSGYYLGSEIWFWEIK